MTLHEAELNRRLSSGAIFYPGWSIGEAIAGRDQVLGIDEPAQAGDNATSRVAPITRLRRFYETLRIFGTRDACAALCESALTKADDFEKLLASSYKHFALYSNVAEPFVEPGAIRAAASDDDGFARQLAFSLRGGWSDGSELAFDFVDYEVSPIRTRKSRFEDGRTARSSGSGGIDALLRSRSSGLPIIGEIKAEGDTNLFLALAQALTYAVELTTPAQRRRLNVHHQFTLTEEETATGPFADVYIMFEGETDPQIRNATFELCQKLRAMKSSMYTRLIGRVVFFECSRSAPASLHPVFAA